MAKSIDYHNYLIESLKNDPNEAAGYLNAALDDGDIDGFLEALRNVVEAYGGMTKLAEKTSKSRNSLYKTVASTGNPYLRNTNEILHALGFHLSVDADKSMGGFIELPLNLVCFPSISYLLTLLILLHLLLTLAIVHLIQQRYRRGRYLKPKKNTTCCYLLIASLMMRFD